MRNIITLLILILFISCDSNIKKYQEIYPFFKNIHINKEANTVTLDNFKSQNYKEGLQYLLDEEGNIVEIRNWDNNFLNGYTFLFTREAKLSVAAEFKNDTLDGNYFEIDTINNSISIWRDKINDHLEQEPIENQTIVFRNKKIDKTVSWYHVINKINDTTICLYLPTLHQFSMPEVRVKESNKNEYIFKIDSITQKIPSRDYTFFYYKIKNKNTKYIVGTIFYKMKKNSVKEGVLSERICYFKLDTQR